MMMPGRQFSAGVGYRYGFNGKENDNEVKGEGNQIDYGMRVHDPRLGRFLSVDPYTKDYPWNTPYAYAENEPISNIDLDGLEKVKSTMSAAAAGAKQYAEEKKSQANGLLKLVTSTEPYRNLWGFAKDWGKAVTGDKTAIQNVNKKTTEVITQTSMAVANGISQPTTFFSTMHTRSVEENVKGLSFYSLKGLELYGAYRLFESPQENYKRRPFSSGVETPYGKAIQSLRSDAIEAVSNVENGATLYRIGTTGKSKAGAEAQFWSLENPLANPEGYTKKYGVPLENITNADFIETATIKPGANFITRPAPEAPGSPVGSGGGIEAVVEKGGTTGNKITPIKRK